MTESRIPPKFVPTLTEEAAQDAADALPQVVPGGAAAGAPDSTPAGVDVLRRRRDADVPASGAWAQPAADIADLPTYSGWAQQADAALPLGSGAQAFAATPTPPVPPPDAAAFALIAAASSNRFWLL